MPNMTISVPDDLARLMEKSPELKWSEIARQGIARKLKQLELTKRMDKALSDNRLSDKELAEILKLAREV